MIAVLLAGKLPSQLGLHLLMDLSTSHQRKAILELDKVQHKMNYIYGS